MKFLQHFTQNKNHNLKNRKRILLVKAKKSFSSVQWENFLVNKISTMIYKHHEAIHTHIDWIGEKSVYEGL